MPADGAHVITQPAIRHDDMTAASNPDSVFLFFMWHPPDIADDTII